MKKELIKYITIGMGAVTTDFVTYRLLGFLLPLSIAKTISYIIGMLFMFVFNRSWTFKSTNKKHKDFIKFSMLYIGSLCLNVLTNHMMLSISPSSITFSFIIATGVSVVINYIGQKFWVFNSK